MLSRSFLNSPAYPHSDLLSVRKGLRDEFNVLRGLPDNRPKNKEANLNAWLVSRNFDILFVCGIAPWIFGFLCFVVTGAGGIFATPKHPQHLLTIFFVFSSLLIGESHQFTSIIRYYTAFRSRSKTYRIQRIPFWFLYFVALIICIAIAFPSLSEFVNWFSPFFQTVFVWAIRLFPVVLMQHVCAQAAAVELIYCRRAGYSISKGERGSFDCVIWLLIAAGAFSIAVPFSDPSVPTLPFTPSMADSFVVAFRACSAIAASLFAVHIVKRGLETKQWPPLGAWLLWTNLALLILLPLHMMLYVWLFVPVFLHASQHWALAWSTQQKEGSDTIVNSESRSKIGEIRRLMLPSLVLTLIMLVFPVGSLFGGAVFVSMFIFYVHYFADRVVWRPKS
jgi:hypothetical protein